MKPYGKPNKLSKHHYKCGYSKCAICTTTSWTTSNSRKRRNDKIIDNEILEPTPTEYLEIENQVILNHYHNDECGFEWFEAQYVPQGISVEGVTPEHALGKVEHEYVEVYDKLEYN